MHDMQFTLFPYIFKGIRMLHQKRHARVDILSKKSKPDPNNKAALKVSKSQI